MSTHNICFCGAIKKYYVDTLAYRELCNLVISCFIMKTCLFKYIENFTTKKGKFSYKDSGVFHISAQNIDCGYSF